MPTCLMAHPTICRVSQCPHSIVHCIVLYVVMLKLFIKYQKKDRSTSKGGYRRGEKYKVLLMMMVAAVGAAATASAATTTSGLGRELMKGL